jgi:hypothetical protein
MGAEHFMTNIRLAQKGGRTIYVEHGIWYDAETKHIHVTIPTATNATGAHWSHARSHKRLPLYRAILEEAGRWPADAD